IPRKHEQARGGIRIPIVNVDFDERDETVAIEMIPKGSGSENGSFLQMLIPADGAAAIKRFVIDRVIECGGRVCPPTIVGVGIGGAPPLCLHLPPNPPAPPPRPPRSGSAGARRQGPPDRAGNRATT